MKSLSTSVISHLHKKWFCFLQKQEPWSSLKSKPSALGSNIGNHILEHAMPRWFPPESRPSWGVGPPRQGQSTHGPGREQSLTRQIIFTSLISYVQNNFSVRSWDVISSYSLYFIPLTNPCHHQEPPVLTREPVSSWELTWELPGERAVIAFLLLLLSPF